MLKWLCNECYEHRMRPIWALGGDCEVKSIPPSVDEKCEDCASPTATRFIALPETN